MTLNPCKSRFKRKLFSKEEVEEEEEKKWENKIPNLVELNHDLVFRVATAKAELELL